MLDKIDLKTKISKEAYAEKIAEEENRLGFLQRTIRDAKIPVIVLFEGFRASWRSQLISKVIHALDPREFRVYSASKTTEKQKESPFFLQFWKELPPAGQICIHHRAWYFLRNEHAVGDPDEASEWYNISFDEINSFEKELVQGGYVLVKIFTHISKKKQKENMEKGQETMGSRWEKLAPGGIEGADYDKYRVVYEDMLAATNTDLAPWHIVPMEDKRTGTEAVFRVLITALEEALKDRERPVDPEKGPARELTIPDILSGYTPYQPMEQEEYSKKLKKYQKRLGELQFELAKRKISTIVAFEGQDEIGRAHV